MADELYKVVDIDGEQFSIQKFTAITGLQIAKMVISRFSILLPYIDNSEGVPPEALLGMVDAIGRLTDEDVENLVKKCLKCCFKQYPAGPQPVIDKMGNYGVEGVEYDIVKTVRLCIEAIKWGTADFFGEKGLTLLREVQPSSQQSQ